MNDEAVHGVPGERVIEPGDLVRIDVTAELGGYVADAATVALPSGPSVHERLRGCAEFALRRESSVARAGRPVSKIGRVVETAVGREGFAVVRGRSGHGIGRTIHDSPTISNHHDRRLRGRLTQELVLTVEPIICTGVRRTVEADDGWTIKTADGSPFAQKRKLRMSMESGVTCATSVLHEHTIVITRSSPMVLTEA